jgi:predicted RNA binding protein YcfA (HicA-like mRNA interferase family)
MAGRQLRGVSGEEAIKAFVKAAGIRRTGKGDHVNIKMLNGQLITIPVHRELKIGLLKAAIRESWLNRRPVFGSAVKWSVLCSTQ